MARHIRRLARPPRPPQAAIREKTKAEPDGAPGRRPRHRVCEGVVSATTRRQQTGRNPPFRADTLPARSVLAIARPNRRSRIVGLPAGLSVEAGKSVLLTELRKLARPGVDVGTWRGCWFKPIVLSQQIRGRPREAGLDPANTDRAPRTFGRINSLVWIAPATHRTSDVAAVSATNAQMTMRLSQQANEYVSSADDVSVLVASQDRHANHMSRAERNTCQPGPAWNHRSESRRSGFRTWSRRTSTPFIAVHSRCPAGPSR